MSAQTDNITWCHEADLFECLEYSKTNKEHGRSSSGKWSEMNSHVNLWYRSYGV